MRTDNYNGNQNQNQNRSFNNNNNNYNNNGGGFGNRAGKVDLRIMLPSKVRTLLALSTFHKYEVLAYFYGPRFLPKDLCHLDFEILKSTIDT